MLDLTATTINIITIRKKPADPPVSPAYGLAIMVALFAVSVVLGLFLVYLSDPVVLLLGALCFFFGIIYSWGPVPISHGPYGELVSGLFYGLLITAILLCINLPEVCLFSYMLYYLKLSVVLNIKSVAGLLMLSVVPFCLTANIMLATISATLSAMWRS